MIFFISAVSAQNVGINIDGAMPDSSAILDVQSDDKGILIPRVELVAANDTLPVTAPKVSLLVYNSVTSGTGVNEVTPGFYFWNGTIWERLNNGGDVTSWKLEGNSGTNPNNDFLGTSDNVDLSIRTNDTERIRVLSTGNVGIGTPTANAKVDIKGSGSSTGTFGLGIRNSSDRYGLVVRDDGNVGVGTTAPDASLRIITPNLGTNDASLRLGPIGGNGSSTSEFSLIDMYATFDNFSADQGPRRTTSIKSFYDGGVWGNETMSFHVGGATDAANLPTERMRIAGNGNVGIGTDDPSQRLDINGQVRIRGGAPAAGKILTSAADGTATWEVPAPVSVPGSIDWTSTVWVNNSDHTVGAGEEVVHFYNMGGTRSIVLGTCNASTNVNRQIVVVNHGSRGSSTTEGTARNISLTSGNTDRFPGLNSWGSSSSGSYNVKTFVCMNVPGVGWRWTWR